jgi:hypothetical protein
VFCSSCGTQVPDGSLFCHSCGARMAPRPSTQASADSPAQRAVAMAPAAGLKADAFQIAVGVVVLAGAVLAIIGTILPSIDLDFLGNANLFDWGYLTDVRDGNGKDGILILVGSLAAGALALHYFFARSALASFAILLLGVGIGALAGYNLGRLLKDAHDDLGLSGGDLLDIVGEGMYLTIAGGVVVALAALVGSIRAALGPARR